jgi:chemotaxis protein CheD
MTNVVPGRRRLDLPGADAILRRSFYLQPGGVHSSAEPTEVVTLLGSCVSVCLFDPAARVGGVNHFLLPQGPSADGSPRYGTNAMALLLEEVLALGASASALRAKVFGGASTLRPAFGRSIAEKNVELALHVLEEARIPVLERDVGGDRGRKLVFHTDVGAAWMRRL